MMKKTVLVVLCLLVMVNGFIIVEAAENNPPQTGLDLWLKADSGVTTDDKGVNSWANSVAGSNIALTQETNNKKPQLVKNAVNGYPVISFSGKALSANLKPAEGNYYEGNYAIYMLMKLPETYDNGATFFSTMDTSGAGLTTGQMFLQRATSDGNIKLTYKHSDSVNQNHVITAQSKLSEYAVLSIVYDGEELKSYVNGELVNTDKGAKLVSSRVFNYYTLGARSTGKNHANCDIAEVLVYHATQTEDDIKQVNDYLLEKYFSDTPDTTYRFTDADGEAADGLTAGGSVTITSSVQPEIEGQKTVTMISALYCGDTLVNMSFDQKPSEDTDAHVCTISNLPSDIGTGDYTLKTFFWESFDKINPLTYAIVYGK